MNSFIDLRRPLLLALLWVSIFLHGCFHENAVQVQLGGSTMGTNYTIIIVDPLEDTNEGVLQEQIDAELERVNALISTYDPESELSQFNASDSTAWTPLASETISLIKVARRISKESEGAYDVTLSTLSELWGFSTQNSDSNGTSSPEFDQVLELMNEVGYQLLLVSGSEVNVRKLTPHLKVDLSSIGKGFAVDRVGELLESNGITRYLVDIGGEIRTRGRAKNAKMWKIGIELPEIGAQKAPSGVQVEDAHIATSGDYRNYREVDGVRVSHLIDGRTGFPIAHNLASVTVLHGSTALADAWATAFMAMGYEQASILADKKGMAAQFTLRVDNAFEVRQSKAFSAYAYTEK